MRFVAKLCVVVSALFHGPGTSFAFIHISSKSRPLGVSIHVSKPIRIQAQSTKVYTRLPANYDYEQNRRYNNDGYDVDGQEYGADSEEEYWRYQDEQEYRTARGARGAYQQRREDWDQGNKRMRQAKKPYLIGTRRGFFSVAAGIIVVSFFAAFNRVTTNGGGDIESNNEMYETMERTTAAKASRAQTPPEFIPAPPPPATITAASLRRAPLTIRPYLDELVRVRAYLMQIAPLCDNPVDFPALRAELRRYPLDSEFVEGTANTLVSQIPLPSNDKRKKASVKLGRELISSLQFLDYFAMVEGDKMRGGKPGAETTDSYDRGKMSKSLRPLLYEVVAKLDDLMVAAYTLTPGAAVAASVNPAATDPRERVRERASGYADRGVDYGYGGDDGSTGSEWERNGSSYMRDRAPPLPPPQPQPSAPRRPSSSRTILGDEFTIDDLAGY